MLPSILIIVKYKPPLGIILAIIVQSLAVIKDSFLLLLFFVSVVVVIAVTSPLSQLQVEQRRDRMLSDGRREVGIWSSYGVKARESGGSCQCQR